MSSEEAAGSFFLKCIENLERGEKARDLGIVGANILPASCIETFIYTAPHRIFLNKDVYNGRLNWLKKAIESGRHGYIDTADALSLAYIRNPFISRPIQESACRISRKEQTEERRTTCLYCVNFVRKTQDRDDWIGDCVMRDNRGLKTVYARNYRGLGGCTHVQDFKALPPKEKIEIVESGPTMDCINGIMEKHVWETSIIDRTRFYENIAETLSNYNPKCNIDGVSCISRIIEAEAVLGASSPADFERESRYGRTQEASRLLSDLLIDNSPVGRLFASPKFNPRTKINDRHTAIEYLFAMIYSFDADKQMPLISALVYLMEKHPSLFDSLMNENLYTSGDSKVNGWQYISENLVAIGSILSQPDVSKKLFEKNCTVEAIPVQCIDLVLQKVPGYIKQYGYMKSEMVWKGRKGFSQRPYMSISKRFTDFITANPDYLKRGDCVSLSAKKSVSCLDSTLGGFAEMRESLRGTDQGSVPSETMDKIVSGAGEGILSGNCLSPSGHYTLCLDKYANYVNPNLIENIFKEGKVKVENLSCMDDDGKPINCIDKSVRSSYELMFAGAVGESVSNKIEELEKKRRRSRSETSIALLASEISGLEQVGTEVEKITGPKRYGRWELDRDPTTLLTSLVKYGNSDLTKINCSTESKSERARDVIREMYAHIARRLIALEALLKKKRSTSTREPIQREIQNLLDTRARFQMAEKSFTGEGSRMIPCIDRLVSVYLEQGRRYDAIINSILESKTRVDLPVCQPLSGTGVYPCIQKIIDSAILEPRIHEGFEYDVLNKKLMRKVLEADAVAKEICRAPGEKKYATCIDYMVKLAGPQFLAGEGTNLLFNKRFKDLTMPIQVGGRTLQLNDYICEGVDLTQVEQRLESMKTGMTVTAGRPSREGEALELVASKCRCRDVPEDDPYLRRLCYDMTCFSGINILRRPKSEWARKYYNDTGRATTPVAYKGDSDHFGLSGVYNIRYSGLQNVQGIRNYVGAVTNELAPALGKISGTKANVKLGGKDREVIVDIEVAPPPKNLYIEPGKKPSEVEPPKNVLADVIPDVINDDFKVYIKVKDAGTNEIINSSIVDVASMFRRESPIPDSLKEEMKSNRTINKIVTSKPSAKDTNYTLTISNRPFDAMRASTCQSWKSCFGFTYGMGGMYTSIPAYLRTGGYIAYLTGENGEMQPTWLARGWVLPVINNRKRYSDETIGRRDHTCFTVQTLHGLPQYKNIMSDAMKVIFRNHGYDDEQCPLRPTGSSEYLSILEKDRFVNQIGEKAINGYIEACIRDKIGDREYCANKARTERRNYGLGTFLTMNQDKGILSQEDSELYGEVVQWGGYIQENPQTKYTDAEISEILGRNADNFVTQVSPLTPSRPESEIPKYILSIRR